MPHRLCLAAALACVVSPVLAQATAIPIPRANFIADMDGEFRKIDANKDGQLVRTEIEAFKRAAAVAAAAQRVRSAFATLDGDKNGQLSLAEFSKLATAAPPAVNAQPFVARMDSGKDGKVNLIEHRTATLANFDRIDSDKDGVVTPAEMKAGGIR